MAAPEAVMDRHVRVAALILTIALGAPRAPLSAQWLRYRDPKIPRTQDGQPDLKAPAPQAPDGKPDLSGVWAASPSDELKGLLGPDAASNPLGADLQFISKYALNLFADLKPEDVPMRPEAAAVFKQRTENQGRDIPTSHCLPGGIPFSSLIAPFKIIQTPGLTVILFEDNNPHRQIYTDGRPHPSDPDPMWVGYSIAHWESDTLVVNTIGLNDRSWLDASGHPHSDALHVTERFHRRDFGHMDLQLTFDDPKMYTRPFSIGVSYRLLPDTDVIESICAENEKDRAHIK
jgi:hypothetical protein